jgi:rhodanese-related sulfurtransferase
MSLISCQTVVDLIDKKYSDRIDEFVIIDCRYDYEYEGGHIHKAINLSKPQMIRKFFDRACKAMAHKTAMARKQSKVAIIFHCEFSQKRGPELCRLFRSMDRKKNENRYPTLDFADTHVMEKGYREFHRLHNSRCQPAGYVEMDDQRFRTLMKTRMKETDTIQKRKLTPIRVPRTASTLFYSSHAKNPVQQPNNSSQSPMMSASPMSPSPMSPAATSRLNAPMQLPSPMSPILFPATSAQRAAVTAMSPLQPMQWQQ